MRKVLVTGGNNFFSRAIVKVFEIGGDWSIYTLHNSESKPVCENAFSVDLLDREQLSKQLSVIKPDVVIHWPTISPSSCDQNEKDGERSIVQSTDNLAQICSKIGAWLLLVSTDQVFDGNSAPYSSNTDTKPITLYGKLFRQAELLLWKYCHHDGGVLRVSSMYGYVNNLDETRVTEIANYVLSGRSTTLDDWQIIYPTYAEDVAVVCRGLAERKMEHCGLYGTWHWTANVGFTEYSLAKEIASYLNKDISAFIKSDNSDKSNKLPHNTQLNCIALVVMGLGKQSSFKDEILSILSSHVK